MFISFFSGKVMLFFGISLIMKEKSNASALTWEQTHPNLGADATESGSRDDRIWEQRRLRLGAEALTNISPPTKDIKSELDVTATNGPHLHLNSKYILPQPP